MNLRSFADVLVKQQGGILLRRGQSRVVELDAEEVEGIFGEKPAAFAAYGLTITIRPSHGERYVMTVRREE